MHKFMRTIGFGGCDSDLEMDKMEAGKEELLKRQLMKVRDQYDYIIIDCPPSLGLLNTNALTNKDKSKL